MVDRVQLRTHPNPPRVGLQDAPSMYPRCSLGWYCVASIPLQHYGYTPTPSPSLTLALTLTHTPHIACLNSGATLEEVRSVLDSTQTIWGNKAQVVVDALWSDLNRRSLQKWSEPKSEGVFSPTIAEIFEANPNITNSHPTVHETSEVFLSPTTTITTTTTTTTTPPPTSSILCLRQHT